MKQFILLTICYCIISTLFSTKVLFIINEHYSNPDDNNNISYFLMKNIIEYLEIDFNYEYVTHLTAMHAIENEEDVLVFPFIRPRNMPNRIMVSDTLYTVTHKVFYNTWIFDFLEVNELSDLRTYTIGSHPRYPFEPAMRRAGFIIHYSRNNQESMEKLASQRVAFVIEEKFLGLNYLLNAEHPDKNRIGMKDIDLFPTSFLVAAPTHNPISKVLIQKINDLIEEKEFLEQIINDFYEPILPNPVPINKNRRNR